MCARRLCVGGLRCPGLLMSQAGIERVVRAALKGPLQGCDAFVCDLSPDEMREYRGTPTVPGRNSPYRDRP